MYAIIELQWHQYIVQKGDSITVDTLNKADGEKVTISNVLGLFDADGKDVKVGQPYVKNATVNAVVTKSQRGEKVTITKFKRKNRYSRTIGFRAEQQVLEIKDISGHE